MVTWSRAYGVPSARSRTGAVLHCPNVSWDVARGWPPRLQLESNGHVEARAVSPAVPQSACPNGQRAPPSAHARTPTYPLRLHKILLDPHRKFPAEELGGRKAKPTCSRAGGDSGMERERQAVARNRKVVLRGYIDRAPREEDMELVDGGAVELRVPEGGGGPAVLVKNLYLSCDPYMRGRMRDFRNSYIPPFKPGSVSFPRFPFHFFGELARLDSFG